MSISGSPSKRPSRANPGRPGGPPRDPDESSGGAGGKDAGGKDAGGKDGGKDADSKDVSGDEVRKTSAGKASTADKSTKSGTKQKTAPPPRGGAKKDRRPTGGGGGGGGGGRQPQRRAKMEAQRQRRNRNMIIAGAVVAVVVVVAAFIIIGATSGNKNKGDRTAIAPAQMTKLTTPVSPSTLAGALKLGEPVTAPSPPPGGVGVPAPVGGKPTVLAVTAEYCPYCAAERWPLTVALSEFGTFSNLRYISSSATDVYPDTPSITYYQAGYTSPYINLASYEIQTRDKKPLQNLPPDAQQIAQTGGGGSVPYVNIAGQSQVNQPAFSPQTLHGMTSQQVASDIGNNDNTYGVLIDKSAGQIVQSICKAIGNKAPVCSQIGH